MHRLLNSVGGPWPLCLKDRKYLKHFSSYLLMVEYKLVACLLLLGRHYPDNQADLSLHYLSDIVFTLVSLCLGGVVIFP